MQSQGIQIFRAENTAAHDCIYCTEKCKVRAYKSLGLKILLLMIVFILSSIFAVFILLPLTPSP